MTEEWGPWIEHDGTHRPEGLDGCIVEAQGIYQTNGSLARAVQEMREIASLPQKLIVDAES